MYRQNPALSEQAQRILTFDEMMDHRDSGASPQRGFPPTGIPPSTFNPNAAVVFPRGARQAGAQQAFEQESNQSFSGSDVEHPAKCICQLCTCGRHRCTRRQDSIPTMSHGDPAHFLTTYGGNYTAHPLAMSPGRVQATVIPRTHTLPASPDQYVTNYSSHYVPHPTERRGASPAYGSRDVQNVPRADQYDTTTARDYPAHDVSRCSPPRIKVDEFAQVQRPFDGTTTYQDNYVPKHGGTVRASASPESHTRGQPFQGETTYHDNYGQPSHVVAVPRSRPVEQTVHVRENRDFVSETQNQYVAHRSAQCPVLNLPVRQGEQRNDHVYFSPSRHSGRLSFK